MRKAQSKPRVTTDEPSKKPLLEKLGVKPGLSIRTVEISDEGFLRQLGKRAGSIAEGQPGEDSDLIFFQAENVQALERLRAMRDRIKKNGAVWAIFPKGQQHLRVTDVIAAAKAAGLVDIKVVSFSPTHTALKLVIPVALR